MKKLLLILVSLNVLNLVYSQNYDLIVKSNGDSIVCHIDSITETHVYFKMMYESIWIHTQVGKTDVYEYRSNAISRRQFVFKPGTSIIESRKPDCLICPDNSKNAYYFELGGSGFLFSINYETRILTNKNNSIFCNVRIGLPITASFPQYITGTNILFGRKNNFFELGITTLNDFSSLPELYVYPALILGYRYYYLNNGKVLRFTFTTFISENLGLYDKRVLPWIGISFGKAF